MMQSRSSLAAAIMIAIALIVIYATRGSHGPEPSVPGRSPSKEDTARTFDYYALVLGWAPTYCLNQGALRNDAECDEHTSRAFTLHGLWPQYEKGWPGDEAVGFQRRDREDARYHAEQEPRHP
jgi:ribonuclease I